MKELNYYKRTWPIKVEKEINANIKDLWEIISRDGNLNHVHPFCKDNYSISWDGINSIDVLEYLNGLKFIREFMTWEPENLLKYVDSIASNLSDSYQLRVKLALSFVATKFPIVGVSSNCFNFNSNSI